MDETDMIEPIEKLIHISQKNLPGSGSLSKTAPNPAGTLLNTGDQVSFNADSLLAALGSETATLKNELPSLIKQALLAPPASAAVAGEPLNALIFRLQDPLKTILGAVDKVPDELFTKIQDELASFKLVFPELKNHELLSPLLNDPKTQGPLNDLLNSLTLQVDRLIGGLRNL